MSVNRKKTDHEVRLFRGWRLISSQDWVPEKVEVRFYGTLVSGQPGNTADLSEVSLFGSGAKCLAAKVRNRFRSRKVRVFGGVFGDEMRFEPVCIPGKLVVTLI
ncbi:hypothetical protein QS306_17285 [Paraburkholderia bonniea]|uniref:hypothetical protein n=1 Tax=Paraburkholderia bonniea TaxID=2152891 RepID=UPI00129256F6|nr:hypothetical protein [Paraburkholderia bonniea]WJF91820.1 hypothetical protein QS306_17285 [Paraburkholderia bonniea]WJF95139.1 hypothetical protein QS308_17285 [Paraburkholderia bonniea]